MERISQGVAGRRGGDPEAKNPQVGRSHGFGLLMTDGLECQLDQTVSDSIRQYQTSPAGPDSIRQYQTVPAGPDSIRS
jgi:hypothetical protein